MPDETDPRLSAIVHNVSRRSLTASQRALAIVTVNAWRRSGVTNKAHPQDAPEKSKKELSEMSKTSTATIDRAKKVITDAVHEVIEAVQSGNALEAAADNMGVRWDQEVLLDTH